MKEKSAKIEEKSEKIKKGQKAKKTAKNTL